MLLMREFGIWMGEPLSPPVMTRRRPVRLGSFGLDPRPAAVSPGGRSGGGESDLRLCATAGDLLGRLYAGGEGRDMATGQIGGFSLESEHDLAMMVSDFMENGSSGAESRHSSDSDSGFADLGHLAETVLIYKHAVTQSESDLLAIVHSLMLSINEVDLYLINEVQCSASCIRQTLVKLLKHSGYDAGVCISKWHSLDKVPGGDHEYIDVILDTAEGSERLIIDIDFHSHFEIARAVESYDAILSSLPPVYVGSLPRLKQFLQVMVDAAKYSLKQNSMPLPPWRSLSYLQAKWFSKSERINNFEVRIRRGNGCDHKQCIQHMQRLKTSIMLESKSEMLMKPILNEKKRRLKSERRRPSLLGY